MLRGRLTPSRIIFTRVSCAHNSDTHIPNPLPSMVSLLPGIQHDDISSGVTLRLVVMFDSGNYDPWGCAMSITFRKCIYKSLLCPCRIFWVDLQLGSRLIDNSPSVGKSTDRFVNIVINIFSLRIYAAFRIDTIDSLIIHVGSGTRETYTAENQIRQLRTRNDTGMFDILLIPMIILHIP